MLELHAKEHNIGLKFWGERLG